MKEEWMDIKQVRCTTCGATLDIKGRPSTHRCDYCQNQMVISHAIQLASLDKEVIDDISNVRENLQQAIHHNNIDDILTHAQNLKNWLHDDLEAGYFFAYAKATRNQPNYMASFLATKPEATEASLEKITKHLIQRSDLRDKDLIEAYLKQYYPSDLDKYLKVYDQRYHQEDQYATIPRDVFICHSSKQKDLAEKLVEVVEDEGHYAWISSRNLRPQDSDNYWKNIEDAIKLSKVVLVVSSKEAMISKDVQKEIELAKKHQKTLIEYKIDEIPHTMYFKHAFDGIKWIEGNLILANKSILIERIYFVLNPISKINKLNKKNVNTKLIKYLMTFSVLIILIGTSISFLFMNSNNLVQDDLTQDTINARNLVLNIDRLQLMPGEEINVYSTFEPEFSVGETVIWQALNQNIVLVSQTGQVIARTAGRTTIIAKAGSLVDTIEVDVGYPIQFETNGGSSIDSFWHYQDRLDNSPTPLRNGYKFKGWFIDEEFQNEFTSESTLNSPTKLFAFWEPNQYKITFFTDQDNVFDEINLDYNSQIGLNKIPSRIGYSFLGWFEDITSDKEFALTSMPSNNIELFAKWGINTYTLTYRVMSPFENISTNIWASAFLTNDGNLYQKGSFPRKLSSNINLIDNEKLIKVFLGGAHGAVLTSSNRVLTWGQNTNGELGDNTFVGKQIPIDITNNFNFTQNETVIRISLGFNFSALLSSEGRLFTWGYNNLGQLGNGLKEKSPTPSEIQHLFDLSLNEKIIDIDIGWDHTMALTNQGRVYSWGNNLYGEVGIDPLEINYQTTPFDITSNFNLLDGEKIISISTGRNHNSIITSLFRIFTWGDNNGKLGDGTNNHSFLPVDITNNFELMENERIDSIQSGGFHTSALSNFGRIFTWGFNSSGQLGDGSTDNSSRPQDITKNFDLINDEEVVDISNSWDHSVAITSFGRVFEWGKKDYSYFSSTDKNLNPIDKTNELLEISFYLIINTMEYNEQIESPVPTRLNYFFGGWYLDEKLTIPFDFETMLAENLVLYASWIPTD